MSNCNLISGLSSADDFDADDAAEWYNVLTGFWKAFQQDIVESISDPNWKNVSWIPTKLNALGGPITVGSEMLIADEGERIAAGLAAATGVGLGALMVFTLPMSGPVAAISGLIAGAAWNEFAQDGVKDAYQEYLQNPGITKTSNEIISTFSEGGYSQSLKVTPDGKISFENSSGLKISQKPNGSGSLETTWEHNGIGVGVDDVGNQFVYKTTGTPFFEAVAPGQQFSSEAASVIATLQGSVKTLIGGDIEDFSDGYDQLETGAVIQNDSGVSKVFDNKISVSASLSGTSIDSKGLSIHHFPDGTFIVGLENKASGKFSTLVRKSDGGYQYYDADSQERIDFLKTDTLTPTEKLKVLEFMARAGMAAGEEIKYLLDNHPEALNNVGACLRDFLRSLAEKINPSQGSGADAANDVQDIDDNSEQRPSPLVFDLDGDGVELTNVSNSDMIYWDHDLDGFAEKTGWVFSDDGLLCIDLNEDGIINNSGELFGDQTGYSNGFLSLAIYDINGDSAITSEDQVWNSLRIWIDSNQNAVSENSELHSLDTLNITSIDVAYTDVNYDLNGNTVLQEAIFTMGGSSYDVVDAYFAVSDMNTIYNETYALDIRALFMSSVSDPPPIIQSRFRLVVNQNHGSDIGDIAWQDSGAVRSRLSGC